MNRFRKEEIAAAKAQFSVLPTPFSWSVSRHLLFRKCRRAYFLHYYFAQGGWDPYADPIYRFAWTAKKSLTYQERLERNMEEILRSCFDTLRNVPPAFRLKMLAIRIQAKLSALESYWSEKEHFCGTFDRKQAIQDLTSACQIFLQSETCSAIVSAQNLTLFNKSFKPWFTFSGEEMWYNPGLIWREGTVLASMRFHFSRVDSGFIRAESDMFALSAEIQTNTKETVSIFRYPENNTWKEIQYNGKADSARKRILSDISEMKSLCSGDRVNMMDFPVSEERVCGTCKFAAVCSAITEEFGEI